MTPEPATGTASGSDAIIRKWSYVAAGAGLIPMPVVDLAAIVGVQLKMVADLSKQYGVEFSQNRGKAAVGALTGGIVSQNLARGAAGSMFKMIPILGQIGGALATSTFAGASTYAVGRVFDKHFASGGTLLDFNAPAMKSTYAAEYEKKAAAKS